MIWVLLVTRCLGCATCVAACPEDEVLSIVHGQAMVVNGARCVGVAACERECPVGAITVTLANLADRADVPALTHDLEAVGTPGLSAAREPAAARCPRRGHVQGDVLAARRRLLRRRVLVVG